MEADICSSLPQVASAQRDKIHKAKWIFMGKRNVVVGCLCGSGPQHEFYMPSPNSKHFMAFYPTSFLLPADFIDGEKADVA